MARAPLRKRRLCKRLGNPEKKKKRAQDKAPPARLACGFNAGQKSAKVFELGNKLADSRLHDAQHQKSPIANCITAGNGGRVPAGKTGRRRKAPISSWLEGTPLYEGSA